MNDLIIICIYDQDLVEEQAKKKHPIYYNVISAYLIYLQKKPKTFI